jgi:hypothetical protein
MPFVAPPAGASGRWFVRYPGELLARAAVRAIVRTWTVLTDAISSTARAEYLKAFSARVVSP